MYQMVIRGGRVMDPGRGYEEKTDIALRGGRIVAMEPIADNDPEIGFMTHVIDAGDCLVVPGLIDIHSHVYPLAGFGAPIEAACFASGVTATLDGGSAGSANYEDRRGVVDNTRLTVKTLLYAAPDGIVSGGGHEDVNPARYNFEATRRLCETYGGEILGLKIRQGAEIVLEHGLEPLKKTIDMAERLGLPVMVHCSNPPGELDDMTNLLRPGDILTHAYQDLASTIIGADGGVTEATRRARERGVLFDVANANAHFGFSVAKAAIADGFLPDTISTDMTINSLYRRPNAFNLLHIMAKYLALGMTLEQVLACVTTNPATWLGLADGEGGLTLGGAADIAVLRVEVQPTVFGDRVGEIVQGNAVLHNMMTVKRGIIVYRDILF